MWRARSTESRIADSVSSTSTTTPVLSPRDGTTPTPMYFAQDYVSLQKWWKVGFVVSLVNLAIWSTIGFLWWKVIGLW